MQARHNILLKSEERGIMRKTDVQKPKIFQSRLGLRILSACFSFGNFFCEFCVCFRRELGRQCSAYFHRKHIGTVSHPLQPGTRPLPIVTGRLPITVVNEKDIQGWFLEWEQGRKQRKQKGLSLTQERISAWQ